MMTSIYCYPMPTRQKGTPSLYFLHNYHETRYLIFPNLSQQFQHTKTTSNLADIGKKP